MMQLRLGSRLSWLAGIGIVLLALCFASATQAATRMYTGSLIIHSFGNDTTTGSVPPYTTGYAVGIPLSGNCNQGPFHAKEIFHFSLPNTPTQNCGTPPCYSVNFTIPTYGGAIPTIDTNGDGNPDFPAGCLLSSVESGDPLIGKGPVNTTGLPSTSRAASNPRGFTLPNFALRNTRGKPHGEHHPGVTPSRAASFSAYTLYLWEVHFADLHNPGGAPFSKNGGDGNFGPLLVNAAKEKRSVTQKAGANKFGGVMQLLGRYGDNEGYYYNNAVTSVYYFNWLFHYLGAGGQAKSPATPDGVVTDAFHTTYNNYGYTKTLGYPVTSTVYVSLFKWTTGTVTVTGMGGPFFTVLQRKGYDNRNEFGYGAVQLVSPMLTKWQGEGTTATAAIGILKVTFAPEPSEWMMLASGVSMLGLMVHRRRGKRRS